MNGYDFNLGNTTLYQVEPLQMSVVFNAVADQPAGDIVGTIYLPQYPNGTSTLNIGSDEVVVFQNGYVASSSDIGLAGGLFGMIAGLNKTNINTPIDAMVRSGSNAQPINPFAQGFNGFYEVGPKNIQFTLTYTTAQTNADAETNKVYISALRYPLQMAMAMLKAGKSLLSGN